jgi:hypothetical protein
MNGRSCRELCCPPYGAYLKFLEDTDPSLAHPTCHLPCRLPESIMEKRKKDAQKAQETILNVTLPIDLTWSKLHHPEPVCKGVLGSPRVPRLEKAVQVPHVPGHWCRLCGCVSNILVRTFIMLGNYYL